MRLQFRGFSIFLAFLLSSCLAFAQTADDKQASSLDRSLQPSQKDEISSLFENVVAVQRKAKIKSGHFLFHTNLSFDFSDAPYNMYAVNLNFGYAVSEFLEIYLNYVPAYSAQERNISKKVRDLPVYPTGPYAGMQPSINAEKAKSSYGVEFNWVPIYGKDSWGAYGIVRSDTFVNVGFGQIKYENSTGVKTKLMLGKTFFLSDTWNLRMQAGGSILDSFSSNLSGVSTKETLVIGLLEGGLVFYF